LRGILLASPERAAILAGVAELQLPDCLVAAGLVRNTVWDHLHGFPLSPLNDVDVVYFEPSGSQDEARRASALLTRQFLKQRFSVKNQARMHRRNKDNPYDSTEGGIRRWPETCTAVGVSFGEAFRVVAPYGLDDLFSLTVRPTDRSVETRDLVLRRFLSKEWSVRWPRLRLCLDD
jgi:hypothetical protein